MIKSKMHGFFFNNVEKARFNNGADDIIQNKLLWKLTMSHRFIKLRQMWNVVLSIFTTYNKQYKLRYIQLNLL